MSNLTIDLIGLSWEQYQTIQDALDKAHKNTDLPSSRFSDLFNVIHEAARSHIWEAHRNGLL